MRRRFLVISLAISAAVCGADEKPLPDMGMWAWSQSAFITKAARKEMLDFCATEDIRHIDQHISMWKQEESWSIQNGKAFVELIVDASKRNISVNALRGGRNMFFQAKHNRAMEQLAGIIAFDRQLPAEAHLAGIKYDVEPYLTEPWKAGGQQRKTVVRDYLVFLDKAKALLDDQAPHLELSIDVPFWWDKAEFITTFNGHTKLLVHHIQDSADWITVMSYRRESSDVLRLVKTELDYASQTSRLNSVAPAINTNRIKGKEHWTTFWGTPPATFRETLRELRRDLSGNRAVRLVMLHHYESLVEYLAGNPKRLSLSTSGETNLKQGISY